MCVGTGPLSLLGCLPLPRRCFGLAVRSSLSTQLGKMVFGNPGDDVGVHVHCGLLEDGTSAEIRTIEIRRKVASFGSAAFPISHTGWP